MTEIADAKLAQAVEVICDALAWVRNSALEEAAKVADEFAQKADMSVYTERLRGITAVAIAQRIRELKEKLPE